MYAICYSNGLEGKKDHITNCYFCMINLKGINYKNKDLFQYSDVPSAIRLISHGLDFPVTELDGNMEYSSDSVVDQQKVRKKDTNSGLCETSILNKSINTA